MELEQYLRVLQRYWKSALATLLACVALAAVVTLVQKPTYSSSASVFITVDSGGTAGELSQGATYAERQVTSYVNVATTAMVLQPVIDELRISLTPRQLAEKLTVTSPAATSIIRVAATDDNPEFVAALANAVADQLTAAVGELAPPGPDGTRLVSATLVDEAPLPAAPTAPRPAMNLALGTLLGLLLGFGQAVLRSLIDTRIKTADDVAAVTDAPVLASIGHVESEAGRAIPSDGKQWASAEAYRRLRTNVGFVGLGGERRPSIVMTSSLAGEGKTETAVNLARVLAAAGDSVLLIDADLRRPQVAARLRLDSEWGLSEVLTGRGTLEELTIAVAPGSFSVLPAGTVPPNPSELLGSEAMAHLVTTAERQYDIVIFDAAPLLPVTDAVVLAAQCGGAIVVARSGRVRRQQLDAALETLHTADVTLLGLVVNDVPIARSDVYEGYYSHSRQPSSGVRSRARADGASPVPAATAR